MTLKQFGARMRRLINRDDVFELLREGDWGAGGCWTLAEALAQFMGPPADLAVVVSGGIPQHVLVRYDDLYIDYDGAQTLGELERKLARDPGYHGQFKIVKFGKNLRRQASKAGIPCDVWATRRLLSKLHEEFSNA